MRNCRSIAFVLGLAGMLVQPLFAEMFVQDFSTSDSVADYWDAKSPTKDQLTLVHGPTSEISIEDGLLKFEKSAGGVANLRRYIPLEGSPVEVMFFSYETDMQFSSSEAGIRLLTGTIGEPGSGKQFMAWGIDSAGADNTWNVTGTTEMFSGVQTVTVVLNNTGRSVDYTDPSGGMKTLETASYDVWVGTVLVADNKTGAYTHPDRQLTAFNMMMSRESCGTFYFDNIRVNESIR